MALSKEEITQAQKRLLLSRMRILCSHGFYGLLLMNMHFAIDEETPTAWTDGYRITFGTSFLKDLSDSELDFVMMHEIMHVVLQHCLRDNYDDHERFNIACDIVVNSNILLENKMNIQSITLKKYGTSMHIAPNGKEGYEFTAEEVFKMLPASKNKGQKIPQRGGNVKGNKGGNGKKGDNAGSALGRGLQEEEKEVKSPNKGIWDDHTHWGEIEEDEELRDVWVKRFEDAVKAITIRDPSNTRGLLPAFAQRMLEELTKPQTDWRTILNAFIQQDISDYSFSPPDRRFQDSPFFLPDFNETEDGDVQNILFMIDTSGSMTDKMITAAYSEIKGAIDQYNGRLKGWLGFFDAAIIKPKPFENEEEFRLIRPAGGGGTDFQIIFEYVHKFMQDNPPVCIIILTDGYAPFPSEKMARDIPVLWLLNNNDVQPPWGMIARIKV